MKSYSGKAVWITGASSGIGEALALGLAARKARLILSARNTDTLERTSKQCLNAGALEVKILPFDLKDSAILQQKTKEAIAAFGGLDVVILNGGIAQRSLAMNTTLEVDREIMEVDYFSCVAISKFLMPHFCEKNAGQLVVVSSVMGIIGTPFRSGYAAAKHALHGYFDSLRAELWKKYKGIQVTLVCPGWVRTNITYNALNGDGSKLDSMDKATAKGIDPQIFAEKMIQKMATGKNTIVLGGWKETLAVVIQRFFPELMVKVVRSAAVR